MGACASSFKVSKDSGDALPPPLAKEDVAAGVVKEEDEGLMTVADDEAKHQSLGQMLIQEDEGDEGLVKIDDSKASGELKQEDAFKSLEAEKTEGKPIQISDTEEGEDKPVAEPVKAVEFDGNEESDRKLEANQGGPIC